MQFRTMNLSALIPADYNPRKELQPGDVSYENLRRSILEFGYVDPLIWNERTGRLVGGHQRLTVLRDLGWKEAEVSVIDLPEDKEKALNIALNKITGEWDMERLRHLLLDLSSGDIDVAITGFDQDEIKEIMQGLPDDTDITEDDFDPEKEAEAIVEPVTLLGDLYLLGDHRLLCDDSRSPATMECLMDGKLADLVCTDPPYNIAYDSLQHHRGRLGKKVGIDRRILNDDMPEDQYYTFLLAAFSAMFAVTKPGGPVYIWHADAHGYTNRRALADAGWLQKQNLIWVKNAFTLGRQDCQWQHESCLYGWKPGAGHYWCGEFNHGTVSDDEENLRKLSKPDLIRLVRRLKNDRCTTVIREDKPLASPLHPTVKPVALIARRIRNSTPPGKNTIVLDGFLGSGTTIVACEQLGRRAFGCELDPVYCDVIVKRWEEFTGKKAELLRREEGSPLEGEDLRGMVPVEAAG